MLGDDAVWTEFLQYKTDRHLLSRYEEQQLRDYVENKCYIPAAAALKARGYDLGRPEKHLVNKAGSDKKRVVYTYGADETMALKLISYLLHRYDDAFAPNCYAFRRHQCAKKAFDVLRATPGIDGMWSYKLDISNYFNSVNVPRLLGQLSPLLSDDPGLYRFFQSMLENREVLSGGEIIYEDNKGVMAGTPTSPFFANLYLNGLDAYFYERGLPYARYSDDIIVFGSESETAMYESTIKDFLARSGLAVNPDKEVRVPPGRAWEFLGFSYLRGKVDLSEMTKRKMKAKIRRRARSLYRWKVRKSASDERAVRAMIRTFNRKFFSVDSGRDLSWARWFFPVIDTDTGLKEIDAYMQQELRYIVTGRHGRMNFERAPYEWLKAQGYVTLVSRYYGRSGSV